MSRRSGQSGSVYVKGSQYIGRYRVDVPGQNKRVRRTVIIGNIDQFTRPKAERWLSKFIEGEGINDESHLGRSQSPVVTFGLAARGWKDHHLIVNKKRSSQRSMSCELNKHILPHLKDTPLEEITYPVVRGLIQTWQREELSRKSIKNLFGIVRAIYNFQIRRNGAKWQTHHVAVDRQMEEGRTTQDRAAGIAVLHRYTNGSRRECREDAVESRVVRSGGRHWGAGRRTFCAES